MKTHTQSAAIKLHSHGNIPVPGPGMNTDVAGFDGWAETVHHHKVSVGVTLEYLKEKHVITNID